MMVEQNLNVLKYVHFKIKERAELNNFDNINPNLFILFRKLVSDFELSEKISNCRTLDDFYSFCSGIVSGYSKNELHEFLMGLALLTFDEKNDKILLKDDLDKVSGGKEMNTLTKKYLSGLLAILNLAYVGFATNVNANSVVADLASKKEDKQEEPTQKAWGKIIKNVALGATAGAVLGAAAYYAHEWITGGLPGGIPNLGNSCYLNSLIQQLYSIKAFREEIMKDNSDDVKVRALKNIFLLIDKGSKIEISEIKNYIRDLGWKGKQEDPMEFLLSERGLGKLLEKYNLENMFSLPLNIEGIPDKTPLEELLKHGGNIQARLIEDKIKQLHPEKSSWDDNDERWAHERSKFLNSPENTEVWKLYGPSQVRAVNRQFGVIINRTLAAYNADGDLVNIKIKKAVHVPDHMIKDGRVYFLTGAVIHLGEEMNTGHYYSYKKNPEDKWVCYNDSQVSVESEKNVMNDIQSNATLLVYSALQ